MRDELFLAVVALEQNAVRVLADDRASVVAGLVAHDDMLTDDIARSRDIRRTLFQDAREGTATGQLSHRASALRAGAEITLHGVRRRGSGPFEHLRRRIAPGDSAWAKVATHRLSARLAGLVQHERTVLRHRGG
ncbi:hypothetical protein [Methylosinus sp. KRF6]|uniref:hypothetical protein n=1 Tax=Methylosinus sp. KRF6 TaxID=2846853 RepID=UPI001C0BD6B7|nr:hypothetical protein [Methylosinus sp. KRF6]MBU3887634.1 hypothetical protein [Methylosinus sp. KRF6]